MNYERRTKHDGRTKTNCKCYLSDSNFLQKKLMQYFTFLYILLYKLCTTFIIRYKQCKEETFSFFLLTEHKCRNIYQINIPLLWTKVLFTINICQCFCTLSFSALHTTDPFLFFFFYTRYVH